MIELPRIETPREQRLAELGRDLLSAAYLLTRNLWVSTGAHVLSDWSLLSAPLLLTAMGPG